MKQAVAVPLPEAASPHEVEPSRLAYLRFLEHAPAVHRAGRAYRDRQWSRQAVLETQRERLKACYEQAVRDVPAYREPAEQGEPKQPQGGIAEMPMLDKRDLQAGFADFVSDSFEPARCYKVTTSGSTGIPLEIVHDDLDLIEECGSTHRMLEAIGASPGDRLARIVSDRSRPMWRIDTQILIGPFDVAIANLLRPDQRWCEETLERLAQWSPDGLFGNPSDLLALAMLKRERNWQAAAPRYIITGGENLSPGARATIEQELGCRVFNVYSMQEVKLIGWECRAGSLHIDEDRILVENGPAPGGESELVITPLCNSAMPLIRYRTGDLGQVVSWEESPCPCGRKLSTIVNFSGRDRGFIVLPDGRLYSPKPLKLYLTTLPVATWQMNQDSAESVEVLIVPRRTAGADALAREAQARLTEMLQGEIDVAVRLAEPSELRMKAGKVQMMNLNAYKQCSSGASA